jgi:hypothetical protein
MRNRISGALPCAALIALCVSTGAQAQETPVVATITVPVTITNLDAEWAKANFVPLSVACDVYSDAAPPESPDGAKAIAQGVQPLSLVETPATPTLRAMFNYSGSVIVQTRAGRKAGGDAETAAQIAAAKAIKEAKSYACYFTAGKDAPSGSTGSGKSSTDPLKKLQDALARGYLGEPGSDTPKREAEKSSTYIISGTFILKK